MVPAQRGRKVNTRAGAAQVQVPAPLSSTTGCQTSPSGKGEDYWKPPPHLGGGQMIVHITWLAPRLEPTKESACWLYRAGHSKYVFNTAWFMNMSGGRQPRHTPAFPFSPALKALLPAPSSCSRQGSSLCRLTHSLFPPPPPPFISPPWLARSWVMVLFGPPRTWFQGFHRWSRRVINHSVCWISTA